MTTPTTSHAEAVSALEARARLANIDVSNFSGKRHAPTEPGTFGSQLNAKLGSTDDGLAFQFELEVRVYDKAGQPLADLVVTVTANYDIPDCPDPDSEVAGFFGASVAFRDVYPFIRQQVHDITARLGMPGLTMSFRPDEFSYDPAGGREDAPTPQEQ